jgi:hypothetical protein
MQSVVDLPMTIARSPADRLACGIEFEWIGCRTDLADLRVSGHGC